MNQPHSVTAESKVCARCGKDYPITYYYKKKSSLDGYERQCKACKNRQVAAAPSRKSKNRKFVWIKWRYGITEQEWLALLDKQGGHCACCTQTKDLVVDHCHTTGKVRGLLCPRCNHGLGHFLDNKQTLQNAITYLESNESIPNTTE